MKLLIAGVMRMSGKAKSNGNPYDFANAKILMPLQVSADENRSVVGFGYEQDEMPIDLELVATLKDVRFPAFFDVTTEPRPKKFGKGFDTVITGLKAEKAA